jgi:DNA-binding PadR family transcriptional regulator
MTAMSADRNDGRDTPDDLSSVFGAAAASSLRTVARHPERVESETTPIDAPVAETSESVDEERQDEQTLDPQESGATTRQVATTASSTSTDARDRARRRRLRPLQVHDRRLIHALLLTAVKGCPEGQNLIDRIRETSDGEILLPAGVVYRELHRLEKERLIEVCRETGKRRYTITPIGDRVLSMRRRQWNDFVYGFARMLEVADSVAAASGE